MGRLVKNAVVLLLIFVCGFVPAASAKSDSSLRKFLYRTEGTYGWQPVKGDISYDFFKDGRLHVQGKDGEATMWQGTWKLEGDQLTLDIPELKSKKTVTAAASGDELLLDGRRYHRYAP